MKNRYLWLLLLLVYTSKATAQSPPDPAVNVLFDDDAYDRFVVKEIRYTVLTQNSNVAGLKVNLGKSEITGTANLKGDDPIQTIEFSISSNSDGLFSLFSNGNFDSKFRVGYNYHYIPFWSASRTSGRDYEHRIARTQYELKKQTFIELRDTVVVMAALLEKADKQFDFLREFGSSPLPDLRKIDLEASTWLTDHSNDPVYQKFLNDIVEIYQPKKGTPLNVPKLYQDLKTKVTTLGNTNTLLADAQIQYFGPFHTSSTRYWLTFSPSVEITPVKAFTAQYELDDFYSAKANIRAQLNILNRNTSKYELWRVGLQAGLTNNVTQLSKEIYAYSKTTTMVKNDSVSVTQQDKADAYLRTSIKNGFGANLILEYFKVPAEAGLRPGLFLSFSPGINTAYRINEKVELPAEVGLVFSLLSDESKAIYLLPYVSFTNLMKFNTDNRLFKRDWLIGLRIGLPFGLQTKK